MYEFPETTDDSFGFCESCSSSNAYFNCDKSPGFETIYIVLAAVGGAIILAVAIGVPVYCYLQNRKRARYERV